MPTTGCRHTVARGLPLDLVGTGNRSAMAPLWRSGGAGVRDTPTQHPDPLARVFVEDVPPFRPAKGSGTRPGPHAMIGLEVSHVVRVDPMMPRP